VTTSTHIGRSAYGDKFGIMRRLVPGLTAAIVLGTALSACFTTTTDFSNDAEAFIVENADLREALLEDPATFTSATCADPASQDEGSTFTCTAFDSTGNRWEFDVVITGPNEYEVNLSRSPSGT